MFLFRTLSALEDDVAASDRAFRSMMEQMRRIEDLSPEAMIALIGDRK